MTHAHTHLHTHVHIETSAPLNTLLSLTLAMLCLVWGFWETYEGEQPPGEV